MKAVLNAEHYLQNFLDALAVPDNELLEFGSFRLDPAEHLLLRGGEPVPLGPKVLETQLVLIRQGGRRPLAESQSLWSRGQETFG